TTLEPRPPPWLLLGQELAQGRADRSQPQGSVDRLQVVEESFDLEAGLLQAPPLRGQISALLAADQVQGHLDRVERVATTMAEPAEHALQVCDPLRVRHHGELRDG